MTTPATHALLSGPVEGLLRQAQAKGGWSPGTASRIDTALEVLPRGELPYKLAELLGLIRTNAQWPAETQRAFYDAARAARGIEAHEPAVGAAHAS